VKKTSQDVMMRNEKVKTVRAMRGKKMLPSASEVSKKYM